MTQAERFSARFDDGQVWKDAGGRDWGTVAEAMGGRRELYERIRPEDDDLPRHRWPVERTYNHNSDTLVRWVFEDGSAVVAAGAGWDIEGDSLCSWRG